MLTGFTHDRNFRVFAFDRIGEGRERTPCTVRADLSLLNKYGIHIQELPLLCRTLLDRHEERAEPPSGTFGESDMQACADERAALRLAAASRRKPPHKPVRETPAAASPGAAWRGQPA
jgi:hypothetical protein